ncbi:NAD(P)/FAD-dependent oxidoreductase [Aestuariivirga sp.]|uniref:NAD(P)/FAD-dependent oxidoreductase n=1 Tax=Aestuariivirga sp. TaxID=2650926 RepID=UPI0039E62D0E
MQNDPRSHGLYEKTAPPPPVTVPLKGDARADVVIVGAGYTGLSAALHLAEKGVKVTVLEAVEAGFGASGRNSGLVNAGMWVMPENLPGVLGKEHGERLLALLGNGPALVWEMIDRHHIACEDVRKGTLHCAVGEQGLSDIRERQRQWKAWGAPVEVLDVDEAARRIGSKAYAGALLDLRAGTIQPLAYARGLAHAAVKAGVTLHTQSPVIATEDAQGQWRVRTAAGSVKAPWVIAATDAYTQGPWGEIRREQIHLPYFNLATAPLSDNIRKSILPGGEGCWDTKEVLSSFRLDAAGRLIFGSVGALRGTGTAIHRAWARRAMHRIFPQIGDVPFETEWYGMIGMTDNHLPKFHRLARNVVGFCGYNGRGIAPGTVLGRVLAKHVLGEIDEAGLPLAVTAPERPSFPAVREAYYEVGAQLAHLVDSRF